MARALTMLPALCLALVALADVSAQGLLRRGDTVEVIVEEAPLMMREQEIARLARGTRMDVASVTQSWIGGYVEIDGRRRMGWLKVTHVMRVAPQPRPVEPQSDPR